MARKSSVVLSPVRVAAVIAVAAIALHLVALWAFTDGLPGAYGLGQVVGGHLVAAIITALIASFTRVGSTGAMVAVYLLALAVSQLLIR